MGDPSMPIGAVFLPQSESGINVPNQFWLLLLVFHIRWFRPNGDRRIPGPACSKCTLPRHSEYARATCTGRIHTRHALEIAWCNAAVALNDARCPVRTCPALEHLSVRTRTVTPVRLIFSNDNTPCLHMRRTAWTHHLHYHSRTT